MLPKNESSPLLSEFTEPSLAAWREEVERLLKGAPYARKMFTRTWENISVGPLYTAADTADLPWLDSLPGQAPFVRGNRAAGCYTAPWLVAQEHRCPTGEEFNRNLRQGLGAGQTAVNLVLDLAGRIGLDPDQAPAALVGREGTSISSLDELMTALAGVDLRRYPLLIQSGAMALPVAAMVAAIAKRQGIDPAELSGCLGCDPYAGLAERGQITGTVAVLHGELAVLTRWVAANAPGMRTLPVFESPWHNGGGDLALSLGLTLASAVATLRAMADQGLAPAAVAPRFQFNLELGTDFFLEMAKLRALRLLWSQILTAAGVSPDKTRTFIHARTARRDLTLLDPHVNMLRATTSGMSAVLGGVDSLHVSPFDEVERIPDEFSRRIARNVQLILAQECHLDQVTDPAGGSWYVESLTRDLAAAAWDHFRSVEQRGGMAAALGSGWVQEQVAAAAGERAVAYATRRAVKVGANQYPDPARLPHGTELSDCDQLRQERAAAVAQQRKSATQEAHMLVLSRLEKMMDCPPDQLFEAMVAAAEAGATLGEFTSVTRASGEPGVEVATIPVRRDSAPFEELVARVAGRREQDPAAARVFTACLGDFARYMPRLDFARGFFQVGGFDVTGETFATEAADVADAARNDGAHTVVLVGLDDTYAELAGPVTELLAQGPQPPTVLVAGAPGGREADLRAAGVHDFIQMRSNVLEVLGALPALKEDRS